MPTFFQHFPEVMYHHKPLACIMKIPLRQIGFLRLGRLKYFLLLSLHLKFSQTFVVIFSSAWVNVDARARSVATCCNRSQNLECTPKTFYFADDYSHVMTI